MKTYNSNKPQGRLQQEALGLIKAEGVVTAPGLSDATGRSAFSCWRALRRLVEKRKIRPRQREGRKAIEYVTGGRERTTGSQNWRTPPDLFARLDALHGPFTLDAAADDTNHLCDDWCRDGLTEDWRGIVWLNPPFANVLEWVEKAIREVEAGNCGRVVMLCYSKTDTRWFHRAQDWGAKIEFLKGRVVYLPPPELHVPNPGKVPQGSLTMVFNA